MTCIRTWGSGPRKICCDLRFSDARMTKRVARFHRALHQGDVTPVTELGAGSAPQLPTVWMSTFRPPNSDQNGPSLKTATSSEPSPEPPQQSNKSGKARHVNLLNTKVVVSNVLISMVAVCPCATTTL